METFRIKLAKELFLEVCTWVEVEDKDPKHLAKWIVSRVDALIDELTEPSKE